MDKSKTLTWTELRVGLVAVVSLTILAFTVLYIGSTGGTAFGRRYRLKALMADVNGLKPGAPVRVGGVDVGSVTGVDFSTAGGGGLVEVAMRVDDRVKGQVTTESQATLGALGLLGEKAVDISVSTRGTPLEDGAYVPAAAEDPFKGLLADASHSTASLKRILSRMDSGEGTLGRALRDEELYNRMADVSRRLQTVMNKLESNDGPLGRLMNDKEMSQRMSASMRSLESAATRLESGTGTLGALSKDEALAADLKALVSRMGVIAEGLQEGKGTAGRMLTDDGLYVKLDRMTTRLDEVLAELQDGKGTASRLLRDAELHDDLAAAVKDLRALLSDMRRDPGKYLRVKLSLF